MPIDPSIPLMARAPQVDILGSMSRVLGLQQQREQLASQREATAALAEQRRASTEQTRASLEAKERERAIVQAASDAVAKIRNGNEAEVLDGLDPQARTVAEQWLGARRESKKKRQTELEAERMRTAKLIRGMGYDPVAMRVALELHGEDDPEAAAIFQQYAEQPEELKRIVDAYATLDEKPGEGYTLTPGSVRYGPNGQPVATNPRQEPAPTAPTVGSFEDYVGRYAQQLGKTPEQLSPADIEAARKRFMQADDRPPRTTINMPRPLTQNAEAQLIGRYQTEWTKANAGIRELDRQMTIMNAGLDAAKRGDVTQANEAILNTFLKVLDPGSVVREGEFWRLKEGQSLIDRAKVAVQRLKDGGWVSGDQLQKYARLAQEIRDAQATNMVPIRSRIERNLQRYNIPPELVFEGDSDDNEGGAGTGESGGNGGTEWVDVGNGIRVRKK